MSETLGGQEPTQPSGDLDVLKQYLAGLWDGHNFRYRELLLLNFYLCNRLAITIRGRDPQPCADDPTRRVVFPEEYWRVVDELLTDCQVGIDRHTGEAVNVGAWVSDSQRGRLLEEAMLGWAHPAFGEEFTDELLSVRNASIGQLALSV